MKFNTKILYISLIGLLLSACSVQKNAVSSEVQQYTQFHKRVAILPFTVRFNDDYKRSGMNRRGATDDKYWNEQERLAGLDIQKDFYLQSTHWVEKGKYQLVFLDYLTTNKKLSEAGISFDKLSMMDKAEIARKIGVDAVIWGDTKVTISNPFSGFIARDGAFTTAQLFDARTGEVLWAQDVSSRPNSNMDTPKRLAAENVRQLAKMLPY